MKRYFTATALSCLLISSTFTISKPVYADEPTEKTIKEVVIKAIVRDHEYTIKLISQGDNIWKADKAWDKIDWVTIDKNKVLDDKSFLSEKDIIFTLNDQYVWQIKKNDVVIGTGIEAELVDKKWTAFCLPTPKETEENKTSKITSETAADLGMKGGATIGGLGGAKAGGIIGATMATTSCLASLGLTVASFGATTLLSVGVCGTAIAAGTATGVAVGGGVGGTLGGFIGKYGIKGVLSYFDAENCVKKELTVKTPNDQAPTYKCEVWCDACKIIKHSRNHFIYASKSQDAEIKAKNEYIAYFTENKTTSDIMARHNKHDHLKATCERIEGTKQ